jgi:hypothetical protein
MDRSPNSIQQQSRQALDHALAILGLPPAPAQPAITRLLELEHNMRALVHENQRLRRQLAALEATLDPERAGVLDAGDRPWTRDGQAGI